MRYLKGSNRIKFKSFRKLEFVWGVITVSCLTSCGVIFDSLAGTTANTPIVNYSDCWVSTTPFNGKYYAQIASFNSINKDRSEYPSKNILIRAQIDQNGNRRDSEKLRQDELLILYINPGITTTSTSSEKFVEIPYQLESQAAEVLERGVMKYNITSMTVQEELSGQTYNLKHCDSFEKYLN